MYIYIYNIVYVFVYIYTLYSLICMHCLFLHSIQYMECTHTHCAACVSSKHIKQYSGRDICSMHCRMAKLYHLVSNTTPHE